MAEKDDDWRPPPPPPWKGDKVWKNLTQEDLEELRKAAEDIRRKIAGSPDK